MKDKEARSDIDYLKVKTERLENDLRILRDRYNTLLLQLGLEEKFVYPHYMLVSVNKE